MTEPQPQYCACEFEIVPGPSPITALESALLKLKDTSCKYAHLSPAERDALRDFLQTVGAW